MAAKLTKPAVATALTAQPPRLVLEAICSTCGPLNASTDTAGLIPDLALRHTERTGHVVILNGTTDRPDTEAVYDT